MWRKSIMPYGCGQSSPRIIVFNHFSSLSFPSSFIYLCIQNGTENLPLRLHAGHFHKE